MSKQVLKSIDHNSLSRDELIQLKEENRNKIDQKRAKTLEIAKAFVLFRNTHCTVGKQTSRTDYEQFYSKYPQLKQDIVDYEISKATLKEKNQKCDY